MDVRITFTLVILCTGILQCLSHVDLPDNWIDPHDMTPSKEYLEYGSSMPMQNYVKTKELMCSCDKTDKLMEAYYKRTINMLLNAVQKDNFVEDLYNGHLDFQINQDSYSLLKSYADGLEGSKSLGKIDSILGEILKKPTRQHLQEYLESWFHRCLNVLFTREGIIALVVISYVYVIYKMIQANFYSMQVFRFLLINFFIFDFVFTWIHLYQKSEIEQMQHRLAHKTIPAECDPESMGSLQFLWSVFKKEDECKTYFEHTYQNIFWKVSPGTVLTEMFGRTIQYPMKYIAAAFADLCSGLFYAFPWPLNVIIFPVTLVFSCIIICIMLSFCFSVPIKFNFFHLISFSFADKSSNRGPTGDILSGANVERLLRLAEDRRPFIEDISLTNSQNAPAGIHNRENSSETEENFRTIGPKNTLVSSTEKTSLSEKYKENRTENYKDTSEEIVPKTKNTTFETCQENRVENLTCEDRSNPETETKTQNMFSNKNQKRTEKLEPNDATTSKNEVEKPAANIKNDNYDKVENKISE